MRRKVMLGALIGWLLVPVARGQNPDDIEFRAELVKKAAVFHSGEAIVVEISYASSAEKKYQANWVGPVPVIGRVQVDVTPREGVTDLRELLRGWAGSIGSTGGYVGKEPRAQDLEVNRWYRFRKAGHFVVTLKSTAVARRKTEEEGGGLEQLTLEAQPVEFDILPEDAAWADAELKEIEGILEQAPEGSGERGEAMHRLALLDSPGSVKRLVEMYLGEGPLGDRTGNVYAGLNGSGQVELIIALLKEALPDAIRNPHALGADLLAEFEVRKEMGGIPARPADAKGQAEWDKKQAEQNKKYNEYYAQANALIVASLKERTGKARAEATYAAWGNAEGLSAGKTETAGVEALREQVLATAQDLELGEQLGFARMTWGKLPHEQLRPLVERVVSGSRGLGGFQHHAYELLCREWKRECAAAILTEVRDPETKIDKFVVLQLPEGERPELDAMLEEQLRDAKPRGSEMASQRMAALVMRAGSEKLVNTVQEFLDRPTEKGQRAYSCEVEAELEGYLFRFAAKDAAKRVLAQTLEEKSECGFGILRTLDRERYSEELLPVAEKTLDSKNLTAAGGAALLLGGHGGPAEKELLTKRLQKLWETWKERAGEMRGGLYLKIEASAREEAVAQAAALEGELVSALVNGAGWKLTDEGREELRAECMTDNCRAEVDGKMRMDF